MSNATAQGYACVLSGSKGLLSRSGPRRVTRRAGAQRTTKLRYGRAWSAEAIRVCFRLSVAIPATATAPLPAPDSGHEPDTGRGAPRIATANRARCTVARPQRSARAG